MEGEEKYGIGNLGRDVKRSLGTLCFGRRKGLRTTESQF
jgi:hypothetical protein